MTPRSGIYGNIVATCPKSYDGRSAKITVTNRHSTITGQRCGEIIIKDHYWHCPETGLAGNAIDFLMRIRGATFHEAMQQLTQPKRS